MRTAVIEGKSALRTWKFIGWPEGDFEIRLHLSARLDPQNRASVMVDLTKSLVPDFVTLSPLYYVNRDYVLGSNLFVRMEHEGLTATIRGDRFLLFQPEKITPKHWAQLDITAGEIHFATETEWK